MDDYTRTKYVIKCLELLEHGTEFQKKNLIWICEKFNGDAMFDNIKMFIDVQWKMGKIEDF